VKYRTVRRWLSVVDGLRRLPPGDRPDAERALEGLCSHKAGVLAPVLGREGEDWQAWVRVAQGTAEPEIQRRVSVALGHRPRGDSQDPGEAWYRALLAKLPDDDFRAETQRAFRLAERETGTDNPIGCFRWIIAEFIATYEPKATA
jgi:hypothetical protein